MYSVIYLCLLLTFLASLGQAAPVQSSTLPPNRSPFVISGPPPAPLIPPKRPSTPQPREPQSITLNGKTFALYEASVPGLVSTPWKMQDATLAAKQFRIYDLDKALAKEKRQLFDYESKVTLRILGSDLATAGESTINGEGQKYGWIIAPSVNGRRLTDRDAFKALGNRKCTAHLNKFVRPDFRRYMGDFLKRTGLVHLDPLESITIWDSTATKMLGIVDFENVDRVHGPLYQGTVDMLHPGKNAKISAPQLAHMLADKYYPNTLCPPPVKHDYTGPKC